jgi:hypothetical protein
MSTQTGSESRLGGDGPVRVTARSTTTGRRGGSPGFLRSSEFLVLIALTIALLIASAIADNFDAARAWTLVTILGAAYILSRGLSKLGRARDGDDLG